MKYCTEDLKRAKRSTTASRFRRPEKNRPQKTLAGKAAGNLSRNQGYGSPGHQTKPKVRELNHLNIHGVNDLDSAPYPGFANTEREKHLIFQFSISPASHTLIQSTLLSGPQGMPQYDGAIIFEDYVKHQTTVR